MNITVHFNDRDKPAKKFYSVSELCLTPDGDSDGNEVSFYHNGDRYAYSDVKQVSAHDPTE